MIPHLGSGSLLNVNVLFSIRKRLQTFLFEHDLLITSTRHFCPRPHPKQQMATRQVPVTFILVSNKQATEWTHMYTVPANLVATTQEHGTPAFQQLFTNTVMEMVRKFQSECDAKAGDSCINCGGRAGPATVTPCSYLDTPEPCIRVLIQPTCGLSMCTNAATTMMQQVMGDVAEEEFRRDLKCEKCGKKEDIKRCAKCKMPAYCSRDCQKSDWKKNKRICPQLVALREWAEEGDN
jgi:hypothetical protein